jgi:hypothetical protein
LGVDAVDLLHELREIGFRFFDEQMIVVGHQAVGMADAIVVREGFSQDLQKDAFVLIIEKDRFPGVAPGGEVIECARIFDTQWSGHGENIANKLPK